MEKITLATAADRKTCLSESIDEFFAGLEEYKMGGRSAKTQTRESIETKSVNIESFGTVLNCITDPTVVLDKKGTILLANNAMTTLIKVKSDEMVGTSLWGAGFLTYESCAVLTTSLENQQKEKDVGPYEVKAKTFDNELKYFEVRCKKIEISTDLVNLLTFHDITQRKNKMKELFIQLTENGQECIEVKGQLIRSERKYRKLFEESIDAIFVVDCESRKIIDCNLAAIDLSGYQKSCLIGQPEAILDAPNSTAGGFSEFVESLASGSRLERRMITREGKMRDVSIKATVIDLDDRKVVYGTFRDITERKVFENRLKKAEKLYHSLFEKAPVGIALVDPASTRFIEFNDTAYQQLGYSREEFSLLAIKDIQAVESADEIRARLNRILHEEKDSFTTQHKAKDGEIRDVAVTVQIIKLDGKDMLLSIYNDITEQQKLKSELLRYSQNLEELVEERTAKLSQLQAQLIKSERLAAIGELAGMVGHDLRNPLTAIKNASYYLNKKRDIIEPAIRDEMLQIVNQSVEHANRIINDLLDYSREMRLETEGCTPKKLISDTLNFVQLPERIKVVTDEIDEGTVYVDINKVERTFSNVVKNAIDAISEEGTLRIACKIQGNYAVFVFQDSGKGIPKEIMPNIFQPLFTTKAQGMGFGLAICKRVIETHKGTIEVNSSDKGTTVTIKLPVTQRNQKAE